MNFPLARPLPAAGRVPHLVVAAIAWLLLATGCGQPPEVAERAALRLTTRELGTDSRFEVVFDDPVARHDDLGVPSESPLRIDPPLAGTYVWRGRRTGIFTPTEPLRLGTRYVFALRSDLHDAEGHAVNARLRRVFETPGLRVSMERHGWWNEAEMPAVPQVVVRFNAAIDPAELRRHARFSDGRTRVPAVVAAFVEDVLPEPGDTNAPPAPTPGLVFSVEPEHALASTNLWNLEITPGVSSSAVPAPLGERSTLELGRAVPFELGETEAANEVHGGRKVRFRFTRPVSTSLATNDPATWFRCEPAVANLKAERSYSGLTLAVSGAFELGKVYTVSVPKGLPGEEPVFLREASETQLQFEPIFPSVWMPEFETLQLPSGRREFALLALNTPETRVRIKALDRHGLIPALRAYERYLRNGNPYAPDTLPGAALDYAGIVGRTIHDATLDTHAPVDEARTRVLSWDQLAGGRTNGAYFVEADLHRLPPAEGRTETRVGPQAIVQLTDIGLVAKTGSQSVWIWAFSHATAKPLAGVAVSLRSDENQVLEEATTDADGLARFRKAGGAAWVLAEAKGDLHAQRLGEGGIPMWSFRLPGGWETPVDTKLFAFTEREAYRPGETLHLKALARTWRGEGWEFPTNREVELQVVGPRGDAVLRTNLALGPTGSTDWTWTVPVGTRGTYRAHLECTPAAHELEFEVRDFQPAAFAVTLGTKPAYGPAEKITVPFSARYLFGQDIANARLLWNARAEDAAFEAKGWELFRFCESTRDWRLRERPETPAEAHHTGSVDVGPDSPRVIAPEIPPNPVFPQPQHVHLTAEVTDLNQQTIAAEAEFVRHSSKFYLGFRWTRGEETVFATNAPLAFQLVAARADGQPWPAPVDAKLRLRRVDWKSVAVLRAGRVVGHQSAPDYHDVSETTVRTQLPARAGNQWDLPSTDAASVAPIAEPGQYVLEFTARDDADFIVMTAIEFHVAGDGHLAWHHANGAQVELVADKETHAAGDTATLLVKSPFDATALVTVEREDVRRAFAVRLQGNAPAVRVPIHTNDSPNVFVGVALVRGTEGNPHAFPMPEWRVGYQTIAVPPLQDRLDVTVKAGPAAPLPGETVAVKAIVRDAAGLAVPGAEVTMYAVDEGYLVLKGTEPPKPFEAFSEPRRLGVATALSLPDLLPEDPELRSFGNKGHLAGGGGRASQERRNFVPCPYWNASLATDANGEVSVSFVAPDSLTRYRVVAVATRGPRAMGTGVDYLEVRKPLMIDSAMPRFAHVDDRLVARALVYNHTEQPRSVRATLVPGTNAEFATAGGGTARVDVAANGTAVVEFPMLLRSPGITDWKWSAEADGVSDAMVVSLPVTHAEAGLRDVRHLRLAAGETNLLAGADAALVEQPDTATVRIAASPIAFLGESVHHLVHYPYGCVEQTGSSLLPWIALRDFPGLLPPGQRAPTNIAAAISAGVQRFWTMQTTDGGLAYWPGEATPQRWGSAYGAWILALARDAGTEVSTNRMQRLHHWLDEQWRADAPNPGPETLHLRCLTAFAFAAAGTPEPALLESLSDSRDRLATEDRALLAAALIQSRGDRGDALALLAMQPRKGEPRGQFGSDVRTDALRLLVHSTIDPLSAETTSLLEKLVGRQNGGHWSTTQDNAWPLWALADQARRSAPPGPIEGELRAGTHVRKFAAGPGDPVATVEIPLSASDAKSGLVLAHRNPSPIHVEITVTGRRPTGTNPPVAIDRGFAIRRKYQKLDAKNHPLPVDGLRVGDRVLVTLDIDAADAADWVAIEDPLPAVLEPVQGVFKTEGTGSALANDAWTSDFREVHSDRTMIFRDSLPEGRHVIRYLARVRAAGDTVAAPAKIEAMYEPQRHGFSGGVRLNAVSGEATQP